MSFPSYVHSVVSGSARTLWPVEGQGMNECGVTVAANALNLVSGWQRFRKDAFVREAGLFFQRGMGGTPSPITGWLIKRYGFGTHFGNLKHTDADAVLCDLIDRGVPVVVEMGLTRMGPVAVYGEHSVLLIGYSEPHTDKAGNTHEHYYFVDSQWPSLGCFDLGANDTDVNGVPTAMPGNRTIPKAEFLSTYHTKIYFPVFRTQSEHDAWYHATMRRRPASPFKRLSEQFLRGSDDVWVGTRRGR